jgi:hypothetical protein
MELRQPSIDTMNLFDLPLPGESQKFEDTFERAKLLKPGNVYHFGRILILPRVGKSSNFKCMSHLSDEARRKLRVLTVVKQLGYIWTIGNVTFTVCAKENDARPPS